MRGRLVKRAKHRAHSNNKSSAIVYSLLAPWLRACLERDSECRVASVHGEDEALPERSERRAVGAAGAATGPAAGAAGPAAAPRAAGGGRGDPVRAADRLPVAVSAGGLPELADGVLVLQPLAG